MVHGCKWAFHTTCAQKFFDKMEERSLEKNFIPVFCWSHLKQKLPNEYEKAISILRKNFEIQMKQHSKTENLKSNEEKINDNENTTVKEDQKGEILKKISEQGVQREDVENHKKQIFQIQRQNRKKVPNLKNSQSRLNQTNIIKNKNTANKTKDKHVQIEQPINNKKDQVNKSIQTDQINEKNNSQKKIDKACQTEQKSKDTINEHSSQNSQIKPLSNQNKTQQLSYQDIKTQSTPIFLHSKRLNLNQVQNDTVKLENLENKENQNAEVHQLLKSIQFLDKNTQMKIKHIVNAQFNNNKRNKLIQPPQALNCEPLIIKKVKMNQLQESMLEKQLISRVQEKRNCILREIKKNETELNQQKKYIKMNKKIIKEQYKNIVENNQDLSSKASQINKSLIQNSHYNSESNSNVPLQQLSSKIKDFKEKLTKQSKIIYINDSLKDMFSMSSEIQKNSNQKIECSIIID